MEMIRRVKKKEEIVYNVLVVIIAVILFMQGVLHVCELKNIVAWDELGYWSNAAYLAGYDWSSAATAFSSYYSYGYSLILAMILLIVRDGSAAYQCAIILNAIFLVGNFLLLIKLGKIVFGNEKKWNVLLAATPAAFYANNLFQCNNAWAECEVIFLYTAVITLAFSLEKKYSFSKFIGIVSLVIYMFYVHNRTVGILIAAMLTLLLMLIKKKNIPLKQFIFALCIGVFLFFGGGYLQDIIRDGVFTELRYSANDISESASWTYYKMSTLDGFIDVVKNFLNRFLYWGYTTYLTFFVVCFCYIRHIVCIIRKEDEISFAKFFFCLSILGNFGVMTIALSQAGSYQALLYGRYQDITVSPIFMIGLMLIFEGVNKWYILFIPILKILITIANTIQIKEDYFVINCNVNLYKYWIGTDKGGYEFYCAFLFSALVFVVLCLSSFIVKDKWKRIYLTVAMIALCLISIGDSENVYDNTFTNYYDMLNEISTIHKVCQNEEEIYLFADSNINMTQPIAMWLQLEMYDHKIIVINDINDITESSYLVIPRRKNEDGYGFDVEVDGECITEDKYVALYLVN